MQLITHDLLSQIANSHTDITYDQDAFRHEGEEIPSARSSSTRPFSSSTCFLSRSAPAPPASALSRSTSRWYSAASRANSSSLLIASEPLSVPDAVPESSVLCYDGMPHSYMLCHYRTYGMSLSDMPYAMSLSDTA